VYLAGLNRIGSLGLNYWWWARQPRGLAVPCATGIKKTKLPPSTISVVVPIFYFKKMTLYFH
jgi:hypothetical protein